MTDQNVVNAEVSAITLLSGPINAFLTSLKENPSSLNIAGQLFALQGQIVALLPQLQTVGVIDGASLLQEKFQAYTNALLSSVQSPATPVVAAVGSTPAATVGNALSAGAQNTVGDVTGLVTDAANATVSAANTANGGAVVGSAFPSADAALSSVTSTK